MIIRMPFDVGAQMTAWLEKLQAENQIEEFEETEYAQTCWLSEDGELFIEFDTEAGTAIVVRPPDEELLEALGENDSIFAEPEDRDPLHAGRES